MTEAKPMKKRKARLLHTELHEAWRDSMCGHCLKSGAIGATMDGPTGLVWKLVCARCNNVTWVKYPSLAALKEAHEIP